METPDWINAHQWDKNIECPMSGLEMAYYNNELLKIFGPAPDGSPAAKLVWGQDLDTVKVYNTIDGHDQFPLDLGWATIKEETTTGAGLLIGFTYRHIGIPRLFVGYWRPDPTERYLITPEGRERRDEAKLPYRTERLYVPICQWDHRLDRWLWEQNIFRNYGLYRPFVENDLERIRRNQQTMRFDPRTPLSPTDLAAITVSDIRPAPIVQEV